MIDACWVCSGPLPDDDPSVVCPKCRKAAAQAQQRNHDAIVQSHTRIVLEDYQRKWGKPAPE